MFFLKIKCSKINILQKIVAKHSIYNQKKINEKKILLGDILALIISSVNAQTSKPANTEKIWRVNFLNLAIELELPTGNSSTFSSALGIGFGGTYPDLTFSGSSFLILTNEIGKAK